MLFCEFRDRGCSEVFDRSHGLRIHLRSCIHKKILSRSRRNSSKSYLAPTPACMPDEFRNIGMSETTSSEAHTELPLNVYADLHTDFDVKDFLRSLDGKSYEEEDLDLSPLDNIMLKLAHITRSSGRRSISELITLLRSDSLSFESFRKRSFNAQDCVKFEEKIIFSKLRNQGFEPVIIHDPDSGIECDVYMRSPAGVLQKQIKGSSTSNTVYNPNERTRDEEISHPLHGKLGREGVPAVTNLIMSHTGRESMWCTEENNGKQSFVGMLQLYSDKSQTTLKESAFQFYPFHITLLNFTEPYRRNCIINGLSLVAFLPVTFFRRIDGERFQMGIGRLERLKMLHLSIECILSELKEKAYQGLNCVDSENVVRVCHPCISSYCCDLPEGKDLTSVKNGNSSLRNCHRCLAKTETFNTYTKEMPRDGNESSLLIQKAFNLRKRMKGKEAEILLHNFSLVEQVSCLQYFPFVGSTPVLDFHAIFHFEPLHNFHLGISKDLKRCLSERLKSEEHVSSSLPTKGGTKRTASFKTLRLTILYGINRMLSHMQTFSPAKGLRIDFSTSSTKNYGSGLYGEDGKLIGMLEGKDYKAVDMVSPFIGMLVDRCCDEVRSAPTTNLFVQYTDIMQMALSYNNNSLSWTEERICKLENMIKKFKSNALTLYGAYQASTLCTEKFHQLDHICEDIRKLGGLRCSDAGLFEREHTDIKRANRSGSRKNHTAMEETVSSYVKEKYHRLKKSMQIDGILNKQLEEGIPAKRVALDSDSACLVQSSTSFTIGDIDRGRRIGRRIRIEKQESNEGNIRELSKELESINKGTQDLLRDIGEGASRVLVNELLDTSTRIGAMESLNKDSVVRRVASGYISGIQVQTASNYDKRWNRIRVAQSLSRRPQRMVSSRGFSGSSVLRQDSVLIQASDPSSSGSINLWAGKILGLFRLPGINTPQSMDYTRGDHEVAFVQFYDTAPPVGEIDKALGCIRLVWATAQEDYRRKSGTEHVDTQLVSPWYSLIPVSSIRGVVHVVRGDYGLNGLCVGKELDSVPWYEQCFYINRYYFESGASEHKHTGA